MTHIFVINPVNFPRSGALENIIAEIEACFPGGGVTDYFFHVSRYPRDATVIIRKYLLTIPKTETVRVYAVGGDGILFDCLNGVVGQANVELASVPYGNTNDFIRAFGEGKNGLFRDIALQMSSPAIPADVIHCGNNYAMNTCSVGIEADTVMTAVELYGRIQKWVNKHPKLNSFLYNALYVLGGVKAVFDKRLINQRYAVTIDGEDWSGEYRNINVANGPCFAGDKNAVVTAMPNDGVLDSIFFRRTKSLKAAGMVVPYMKGEFRRFPETFIWKRLVKIEIRSDDPLFIQLDGETFFDTNITIEIIPAGVRFVAPGGISFQKRMDMDENNE